MIIVQTKGDKTKEKIIAVSKEMFRNIGYDQVLIKDISTAANIAPGNLNYYFPTKESIAFELVDRYIQRIEEFVKKNMPNLSSTYEKILYMSLIYYINVLNDKQTLRFFKELVHKKKTHHSLIVHGLEDVYRAVIHEFDLDMKKLDYKYFSYADMGARQEILVNYLDGRFPELDAIGLCRVIQTNTMRLMGIDSELFDRMISQATANIGKYDFSQIRLLD